MVGAAEKAERYAVEAEAHIASIRSAAASLPFRPRVYFEEWDVPPISGIRWVAELVRIAGGDDIFPELAEKSLARDRIIADAEEIVRRKPDLILGSWCGKKFRPDSVAARPGWSAVPAVRNGQLHEIKSPIILQPGPAALFDGLDAIHQRVAAVALDTQRD
jgi:iron complex transport system substrate-binding protein